MKLIKGYFICLASTSDDANGRGFLVYKGMNSGILQYVKLMLSTSVHWKTEGTYCHIHVIRG